MSGSTSWFSWFSFPFFAPLSGAVSQEMSVSFYRGDPATEAEIARKVGLGRQLGIISEALDDLIKQMKSADGANLSGALDVNMASVVAKPAEPASFARLHEMVEKIKEIKKSNELSAEENAAAAIERLERLKPDAADRLAERFRSR